MILFEESENSDFFCFCFFSVMIDSCLPQTCLALSNCNIYSFSGNPVITTWQVRIHLS